MVILCIGQSMLNANGHGEYVSDNVQIWNGSSFERLVDPGEATSVSCFSILGKILWQDDNNRTIQFINTAVNGVGWIHWSDTETYDYLQNAINACNLATNNAGPDFVMMFGGETGIASSASYATKLGWIESIISDLRSEWNQSLPFVINTLWTFTAYSSYNWQFRESRRSHMMADAANHGTLTYYTQAVDIDMPDCVDGLHYDANGLDVVGERMANAILYHLGDSSYWRGPYVDTASITVNEAKTEVTIPITGAVTVSAGALTGWRFEDDTGPLTPTSLALSNGNIVAGFSSALDGILTVGYLDTAVPDLSNLVIGTDSIPLPLEIVTYEFNTDVDEGGQPETIVSNVYTHDITEITMDQLELGSTKILVVFKIGDRSTTGARDFEILALFDPNDGNVPIMSNKMGIVFGMIAVSNTYKSAIQAAITYNAAAQISGSQTRKVIDNSLLDADYITALRGKNAIAEMQDFSATFDTDWILTKNFTGLSLIEDMNVVSTGTYTIGSGGDYASWKLANDDTAATQTGALTFQYISAVSEPTNFSISHNNGGYDYTITADTPTGGNQSAGRLATIGSIGTNNFCYVTMNGTGDFIVDGCNFKLSANIGNRGILTFISGVNFRHIKNTMFDGNGFDGCAIVHSDVGKHKIHSNIFTNFQGANSKGIRVTNCNSASVIEFNTVHNCQVRGISLEAAITTKATSNYCCDNGVDYYAGTGTFTDFSNQKNASSDTTGSEVGLQSLTTLSEVQSVTIGDGDTFLQPKGSSALNDAATPTYATVYIDGDAISTYIGAKNVGVVTPTFTSITPEDGATTGYTYVTIVGTNFKATQGGGTVTLKGVDLDTYLSWSDTEIVGVTDTGTAGVGDVVITNDDLESVTETSGWTYSELGGGGGGTRSKSGTILGIKRGAF